MGSCLHNRSRFSYRAHFDDGMDESRVITPDCWKMQAVYWSRSRGKLWHKGESSGHFQQVHEIRLDCDADVIVLSVTQVGGIVATRVGSPVLSSACRWPRTATMANHWCGHQRPWCDLWWHRQTDSWTLAACRQFEQTSNSTQTATTSADILTALDEVLIGRKMPILIAHTWQAYTTKVSTKS